MAKHKRPFESSTSSGGEGQRHYKLPAPSTQIQDALKGFASQIDTLLKNAIQELVCKGMDHANLQSFELAKRTLPKSTQIAGARNLQLCFKSNLSLPLYTGMQLEGQQGCPIQVELIDANTGKVVTSGPESSAKLDVVVLKGDFNQEDNDTWSVTEFEKYIVIEREGKRPLLTGKLQVKLREGIGELGSLKFTDNSSWNSCKKFRIGVKVASGFCEGIRVREAITEAFLVRDQRGEAYKKHHPPASDDEIWRLEEIGKAGAYCKRLHEEGIHIVEQFVRTLVGDSKKLRNVLGSGMPDKKWNVLIKHAYTCVPNGKSYVYYCADTKDNGVVISNICQLTGFITGGVYHTTDQLSHSQKVHADNLVKAASKNWNHVKEISAESFSSPMLGKSMTACPVEFPMNQQIYVNPSDCHLTPLNFPRTQSSEVPLGISVTVSDTTIGFGNVNQDHGVGITPQSLRLSPNTDLSSIISEQDANPWNQQETFGKENLQCTELHESPLPFWLRSSPSQGESFMEELWPSSNNFGGNNYV